MKMRTTRRLGTSDDQRRLRAPGLPSPRESALPGDDEVHAQRGRRHGSPRDAYPESVLIPAIHDREKLDGGERHGGIRRAGCADGHRDRREITNEETRGGGGANPDSHRFPSSSRAGTRVAGRFHTQIEAVVLYGMAAQKDRVSSRRAMTNVRCVVPGWPAREPELGVACA